MSDLTQRVPAKCGIVLCTEDQAKRFHAGAFKEGGFCLPARQVHSGWALDWWTPEQSAQIHAEAVREDELRTIASQGAMDVPA